MFYNLLFLFFVVCFPFSASGLEHFRPSFFLPMYIYAINLGFVFFAQYALCNYVFNTEKHLSRDGHDAEKKYLLLKSKYFAIAVCSSVLLVLAFSFFFPNFKYLPVLGFYGFAIMAGFIKRRLKKYKVAV